MRVRILSCNRISRDEITAAIAAVRAEIDRILENTRRDARGGWRTAIKPRLDHSIFPGLIFDRLF